MSTMNRMTAKTFFKTLDKFESQKEMVERAVHPTRPGLVKSHPKNREKLDDTFIELVHDWKDFKRDINVTSEVFNEIDDEGAYKYEHNDKWMEDFKESYYELVEKSEAKLEEVEALSVPLPNTNEDKVNLEVVQKQKQMRKLCDSLAGQVQLCSENITSSIDKIHTEVRDMVDGEESRSKVQSLMSVLQTLDEKIDGTFNSLVNQYVGLLDDSEVDEKELMRSDVSRREKLRISNLLLSLSRKIKDSSPSHSSHSSTGERKEQTFLKKTDPPKWEGDPVFFADFMRKWKSQVSPANLPAESELDRLRESIPVQASKALFGEKEMSKAWKILESLYGDKDLIANKLKTQLKTIKVKAKHDYDVVIELVTDVNNIVLRLKAIDMELILHNDSEFLSAVFRALPSKYQDKWLDFDKSLYSSKWAALMKFLDVSRDQALQTKVMFSGFEIDSEKIDKGLSCRNCHADGHIAKNCPNKKAVAASASVKAAGYRSEEKKVDMQKSRDECGKCPLCKKRHTYFKSKDKEFYPSDRLFKCDQFLSLSLKDKADTLERLGCCAKCTSWSHKKTACPAIAKCGRYTNGVKCDGEHSHLVCGSGNAYCGAVRPMMLSSSSFSSSEDSDSSSCSDAFPDLSAETLLMFQEVKVLGADKTGHLCWDKGSTRCLITHKYAEACGL